MAKSISQIRNEIAGFYLSVQDEVNDVSTGSVSGGLIYSVAAGLKELYDLLANLESQAYIATASGRYLDLLIEGGFFLPRTGATRSVGYVILYSDDKIVDIEAAENSLLCAEFDYQTGTFVNGLSYSTKFSGENSFGSQIVYSLIQPANSSFYKRDSQDRITINLKGKNAKYLILPVASVLSGNQVNLPEGALNIYNTPKSEVRYVSSSPSLSDLLFSFPGVSTAPFYSRNTSMLSFQRGLSSTELGSSRFNVVNAFNFSSRGFLEIFYKASNPASLINATYVNPSDSTDEVGGGLIFEYINRTQTFIPVSPISYVRIYRNNELKTYRLKQFTYEGITYYFTGTAEQENVNWFSNIPTTFSNGQQIGPGQAVGDSLFFSSFLGANTNWILQQRRDQISEDIVFDPDFALFSDTYIIKDTARLSSAKNALTDNEYRDYFRRYISSLPRSTGTALEFGALSIPGISFAKTLSREESPIGTAVLLTADVNGVLSPDKRNEVYAFLKDDWVAAGVNLVVRNPDLLSVLITVSVELTDLSLENFVRINILDSLRSYLSSLNPGDQVKYGDIYGVIAGIPGVRSVSKLVLGKDDPNHYLEYTHNYALSAIDACVSNFGEDMYTVVEDSMCSNFSNNEGIQIYAYNAGVNITPISFSAIDNIFPKENIFNRFNDKIYGAVEGIYISPNFIQSGTLILTPSDKTETVYPFDDYEISDNAVLGIGIEIDPSNASDVDFSDFSVTINGVEKFPEFYRLSSGNYRGSVFFDALPTNSSDISVTFSRDFSSSDADDITVKGVQLFLHDDSLDYYMFFEYEDFFKLDFIDMTRVGLIYDMKRKSSRVKLLNLIIPYAEQSPGLLFNLYKGLTGATTLSVFKSLLKDYQYGTNVSGRNNLSSPILGNVATTYKNAFADNQEDFNYFYVYGITAPFSQSFDSIYPINPEKITNKNISDYTLSPTELARFKQLVFGTPGTTPESGLGILVNAS